MATVKPKETADAGLLKNFLDLGNGLFFWVLVLMNLMFYIASFPPGVTDSPVELGCQVTEKGISVTQDIFCLSDPKLPNSRFCENYHSYFIQVETEKENNSLKMYSGKQSYDMKTVGNKCKVEIKRFPHKEFENSIISLMASVTIFSVFFRCVFYFATIYIRVTTHNPEEEENKSEFQKMAERQMKEE